MRSLLICPSKRLAIAHLAVSGPLATAPLLGSFIVGHWIEHLAGLGARHIQVVCADGAEEVRAAVGDGAQWGVRIEVVASRVEPTLKEAANRYLKDGESGLLPPPHDIVALSHLPGCPESPLFESYAGWFAALLAWLPRALTPSRIRVSEIRPGIWAGSRARVSRRAELIAPCWIGDQAFIEDGAVVGPAAIIEDRAVVAKKAIVTHSWVGPETLVGQMTSVANSLALGSTLIDWRSDSALHVPDPFLLSSLAKIPSTVETDRFGRARRTLVSTGSRAAIVSALRAPIGHPASLKQSG